MGAAKLKSRLQKQSKENMVMTSHFEFLPRRFGIILAEFIVAFEKPSASDKIHSFKTVLIQLKHLSLETLTATSISIGTAG